MLSQISKSMGWPFTLVYLALIISALYFTFVGAPKALNTNDWPSVQGKVTQSELIARKRSTKNSDIVTVYSAKIHFLYVLDGKSYTGLQTKLADRNRDKIKTLIEKEYSPEADVTVFYNPQKPFEAVLQQGLSLAHILTGIFLLVSISAMAWALYHNARNRK